MHMRIIVGVDDSEHSQRAVAWCAKYAPALDAEVVAVHAIETPVYAVPTMAYVPIPPLSEEDRLRLHDTIRSEWCGELERARVTYRVVSAEGPPASVIIEVAEREDADLVVTGRRGRGGFAELVLGSTSHSLTHHLQRPLVIVP